MMKRPFSHRRPSRVRAKMRDTSGSSILLALAFFLICAIIGSIVLTAASVNTQATVTYQETQQAEYTVTSAANLLGEQLEGTSVAIAYPAKSQDPESSDSDTPIASTPPEITVTDKYADKNGLATELWEKHGQSILSAYKKAAFAVPDPFTVSAGADFDPVYAWIVFDRDLNITITLSLSDTRSEASPYDEVVALQATPTFDGAGKLVSVSWDDCTISKAASGGKGGA